MSDLAPAGVDNIQYQLSKIAFFEWVCSLNDAQVALWTELRDAGVDLITAVKQVNQLKERE